MADSRLFVETLPQKGTYQYQSNDVPFTYRCTGRRGPLRISLPTNAPGPPHMVFLNHGAASQLGGKALNFYEPLRKALCSTGLFAVISPLYADGQDPTLGTSGWRECHAELDELANRAGELGTWASNKYGAMGHSFGCDRVAGVKGLHYSTSRSEEPLIDNEHITCMALWSPQGDDERVIAPECWSRIECPILSITGTKEGGGRAGEDYTWRLQLHENAPASIEHTLFLHKCDHDHGGAVGVPNHIVDRSTSEAVCDVTLAFFCAHLLDNQAAKRWLRDGAQKWKNVLERYEYIPPA